MLLIFAIIIPILFGLFLPMLKLSDNYRKIYISLGTVATSILTYYIIFSNSEYFLRILNINEAFSIVLSADGLSNLFSLLVATLWPLATVYSFDYMKHEENEDSFFRYYMIAYGITLGVSFSDNLITMYLFYELLTFLTLPLIMHKKDKKSLYAGKIYLIVSLLGASMALMGIIILSMNVSNTNFILGGHVGSLVRDNYNMLYIGYALCFVGFGVKAAILPFSFWLPICGVAPTPVTALLHAVAVVKAGVFAVMRVTYYSFGIDFLAGTYVQQFAMALSILTIIFSAIMAVKETDLKRRFAYSTVSNLSYIMFAITLMTNKGLAASITHMLFHGIIKILIFMIIGAIIVYTGSKKVSEIRGYAKNMKISFFCFTIASLALIGIPLTCGFISKLSIANAAISMGSNLSMIGLGSIILSSILATIYTFTIIVPAYFPEFMKTDNKDLTTKTEVSGNVVDPSLYMLIPFIILTIMIIYFGLSSATLVDMIEGVASGLQ